MLPSASGMEPPWFVVAVKGANTGARSRVYSSSRRTVGFCFAWYFRAWAKNHKPSRLDMECRVDSRCKGLLCSIWVLLPLAPPPALGGGCQTRAKGTVLPEWTPGVFSGIPGFIHLCCQHMHAHSSNASGPSEATSARVALLGLYGLLEPFWRALFSSLRRERDSRGHRPRGGKREQGRQHPQTAGRKAS